MRYNEVIGLDIGLHSVKAVRAERRGGQVAFSNATRVRLASDEEERKRLLAPLIEKNRWQSLPCVIAVPGRSVMLQSVSVAPEDKRPLKDICREEVARFAEVSSAGTVSDTLCHGTIAGKRRAVLAVARMDGVLRTMQLAAELGLKVVDMLPGSAAVFNTAAFTAEGGRGCVACVDIGFGSSEIAVGLDGRLLFARHLTKGAGAFFDMTTRQEDGSAAGETVPAEVAKWTAEFTSCLSLFERQFPDAATKVSQIILCGGGALVPGVRDSVQRSTGVKTVLLGETELPLSEEEMELFGRASGLALAGIGKAAAKLSLLPLPVRQKIILQRNKKYWYLTAACLLLAGACLAGSSYARLRTRQNELARVRQQRAEQRGLDNDLATYREHNDRLEKQIAPLKAAVHNSEVTRAVIRAVGNTKHDDDCTVLVADAASYGNGSEARETANSTNEFEGFTRIIIEGYTPYADLSTVRRMIADLKHSAGITEADILGDDQVRKNFERDKHWADTECRLFAMGITVARP